MKNHPPCAEWADKIGLKYEDLSTQEYATLNAHLQTCEFCSSAYQDYTLLTGRIQALPLSRVKPLPRLSLALDKKVYAHEAIENRIVDRHFVIRHQPYKDILSGSLFLACVVIVSLLLFSHQNIKNSRTGVQVPIGTIITSYNHHSDWIHTLSWSGDKGTIASIGDDYTVYVWNAKNSHTLLTTRTGSSSAITLSPDGKEVAFVKEGQADTFVVEDISTRKEIFKCKDKGTSISILAWSPNGQKIVSADDQGTIQIWSISQKQSIFTGAYNFLTSMAWSPDSSRLVLANFKAEVQVWNAQNGHVITTYTGHTDSVSSVTWSPDGTNIASASFDSTVRVWDAKSGKTRFIYKGHNTSVLTVAWSPDGTNIASGSDDGTVQIWNALTGKRLYVYTEHTSPVSSIVWSPDGEYIASCTNKTINVWRA